jgi:ATP-dependent Clp protease ATP-binding subunit ClpC
MFEKFNQKARMVIYYGRYEASQFGSRKIEPEHVLLGFLREDGSAFATVFGLTEPEAIIRGQIESRAPHGERIPFEAELPLSGETKKVLFRTAEESDRAGHRYIGPEHLLLGLLREEGSLAAAVLNEQGVSYEMAKERLKSWPAGELKG